MKTVLVTGATSLLGYHVARRLNERGIRPRVLELAGSRVTPLETLQVDRVEGHLEDPQACEQACAGVDTVLHLAFKVGVGGGAGLLEEMRRVNVAGSTRLLSIAAAKGVARAVVASSALAVGVNRRPEPLSEDASWPEHTLGLPYADIRREAEQQSLAMASPTFAVVAVSPSFTLGPDDPVGAPANTLVKTLINGKLRFTLTVGFSCLDVRDFAEGVLLAAERGTSGRRYLLTGENVTTNQLLERTAAIADVRPPRFEPPKFLLHAVVGAIEGISSVRGKPSPITRSVLRVIGRYAWYDASRARAELGWSPRPLQETLTDTVRWLRDQKP